MTLFDFNVEIISSEQNITQANQLKLLFIWTDNMNIKKLPTFFIAEYIVRTILTSILVCCLYI